jgi:hemerythrin superfamily protein
MPQVYEILKQEHQEVSQLLEQITEQGASKEQIDELYMMLEAHTKGEEQTLYKDLKKSEQTHELILEAIEEHHVADMLLKEIRQMDPSDEVCQAKLKVLKETVEHHVKEEEQELFPKAQQVMDDQWAQKMGEQYEQKEQQLKQQMQ